MESESMDEVDLGPTPKQIRALFYLGIMPEQSMLLTRSVASSKIESLREEQARRREQRRAEQAVREQSPHVAAAWKKLQEMEDRRLEADWEKIQKGFAVVVEESSNTDMGDVQSASQRIND